MFKWLRYMLSPNTALHEAAQLRKAAVEAAQRQTNWTERALDRLDEWESCVNALCFSGVIGTGDAVLEIEHIARIRKELGFRVNDPEWNAARNAADTGASLGASKLSAAVPPMRSNYWKPGIEHQQPHPVKENPDGTLFYKGWVYRKIGDHGPKTPREQHRRRRWNKGQNGV